MVGSSGAAALAAAAAAATTASLAPHGKQVTAMGAGLLGSWGWWDWCARRPCSGRCSLRRLGLGLFAGREPNYICVGGSLLGVPRLFFQPLVLHLCCLILLPVAVNSCLEMVMEENARLPIAAVPQHPKLLQGLGHGMS